MLIYLTICSIFFLYLASMSCLYSGLMSIVAKLYAEACSPALWHSITVDVRIGTMSIDYAQRLLGGVHNSIVRFIIIL